LYFAAGAFEETPVKTVTLAKEKRKRIQSTPKKARETKGPKNISKNLKTRL